MTRKLAACGLAALALAGTSTASWLTGGSGNGSARALSLGAGSAPAVGTITGTLTKDVPLSWTAVAHATGYTIRRYNDATGLLTIIGGTCTGVVASTTCVDQNVALGLTWRYTVQPQSNLWLGAEGPATIVTT